MVCHYIGPSLQYAIYNKSIKAHKNSLWKVVYACGNVVALIFM